MCRSISFRARRASLPTAASLPFQRREHHRTVRSRRGQSRARDGLAPGNVLGCSTPDRWYPTTTKGFFQPPNIGAKKVQLPSERTGTFMVSDLRQHQLRLIMEATNVIRVGTRSRTHKASANLDFSAPKRAENLLPLRDNRPMQGPTRCVHGWRCRARRFSMFPPDRCLRSVGRHFRLHRRLGRRAPLRRNSGAACEFLRGAAGLPTAAELAWLKGSRHHLVSFTDGRYPVSLRELARGPIALYVEDEQMSSMIRSSRLSAAAIHAVGRTPPSSSPSRSRMRLSITSGLAKHR